MRTKSSNKKNMKKQIMASCNVDDAIIAPDVLEYLHAQGLTMRQYRFAHQLLADPNMNIGDAAVRAGYAPEHAAKQGSAILKLPAIRKIVNKALYNRAKRLFITQDNVIMDISNLARCNPQDFYYDTGALKKIQDLTADQARCIKSIVTNTDFDGITTTKLTFHSKIKPFELLAKHVGLIDSRAADAFDGVNGGHQISVDDSAEHMAKVLTILMKSGAITPEDTIQEAEYEEVS